jgi:hypothetical protein
MVIHCRGCAPSALTGLALHKADNGVMDLTTNYD